MFLCSFSNCCGSAKLSSRSKTVSLSKGGNASQSSWYELLPENEGFRDSRGLPGEDALNCGVLLPSGGDESVEDGTRVTSGERLLVSNVASGFEPGIGIGSDISKIVCGGVRGLS